MSFIDDKRDKLEKFIQEQMIGPGGCAGRFGKVGLPPKKEEILNTTPGSVYNTAILFPKKAENAHNDQHSVVEDDDEKEISVINTEEDDVDNNDKDSGNSDRDDDFSMERRFPSAMAISCCLEEDVDLNQDVKIRITGRYYRKIKELDKKKVYIAVPEERIEILASNLAQDDYIRDAFIFSDGKFSFSPDFNTSETSVKDLSNHIKDLNISLARLIRVRVQEKEWGEDVFAGLEDQYLFLSTCRRKLFDKLQNRNTDRKHAQEIKSLIDKIGQYEQSILDMEDLMALYYGKGYGFWESKPLDPDSTDWIVDLSDIPFDQQRRSYAPSQKNCENLKKTIDTYTRKIDGNDTTVEMSLSVLLQITKDHRNTGNHNKYLKVMLQNSTTDFVETPQDHYTIVNEELNKACFFGVKIEIESEYIRPYKKGETYSDVNKEEDRLKFLYRNVNDYGVGHLCSIDWDRTRTNPTKVWSEFLPTQDVPDVEFTPRNKRVTWIAERIDDKDQIVPPAFLENNNCLNLHRLSTFSDVKNSQIVSDLTEFIDKYQQWIDLLPEKEGNDAKYDEFAKYTKKQCQKDCDRIRTNIDRILYDDKNMLSFRLMNSAMLMQMWHNKDNYAQITNRLTPSFYSNKGTEYNWRPFQLAFILLNLDGIIQRDDDLKWERRNEYVDLVWFPTGGGKTEAYLGIIALTIINRRRNYGEQAAGTTAIMRYTLRLLATQQFERALKLILALDQIRIWGNDNQYPNYYLGTDAISIGLFVGKSSLPNSYLELDTIAKQWDRRNQQNHQNTNIPLDRCPWCGSPLRWSSMGNRYRYARQFSCPNDNCTFTDEHRLPVQLCDEQVYADPPTLLFGTVDKFAQLARKVSTRQDSINKDSRRLFGTGDGIDYLTPDLIIQDELHLLLGPLGSAVSLFEAAIDQLCTRETTVNNETIKVRPKIISSTATTRNTELQIRALYDRGINIFPKSGVDYDDSFFAFYKRKRVDDNIEWVSKRRYKGIMPTGRTQMLMQLRLAAILFVHRAKFEKEHWQEGINDDDYNKAADNYYSIISYFNSLKEVGKTDAQYPYEFTKYLQRLYLRVIGHCGLLDCLYADENTLSKEELTGRLSGPQVVSTLDKVQRPFNVNHRLIHFDLAKNEVASGFTPPDYILATNMISVGIDVDRFNTIIMNSMPRNVAEYIQASSRVARKHKGLVLTSHNPYRMRDVSHFEKFIEFHEKMYYYVDPISITPFSSKAVYKYLPLYLATIIRHRFDKGHGFDGLQNNKDAIHINDAQIDRNRLINEIIDYFQTRKNLNQAYANIVKDNELQEQLKNIFTDEMALVIEQFVNTAIQQWTDMANGGDLWYYDDKSRRDRPNQFLYTETEDYDDTRNDSYWTVPNSLRIVEPEAVLTIKNMYNE